MIIHYLFFIKFVISFYSFTKFYTFILRIKLFYFDNKILSSLLLQHRKFAPPYIYFFRNLNKVVFIFLFFLLLRNCLLYSKLLAFIFTSIMQEFLKFKNA